MASGRFVCLTRHIRKGQAHFVLQDGGLLGPRRLHADIAVQRSGFLSACHRCRRSGCLLFLRTAAALDFM